MKIKILIALIACIGISLKAQSTAGRVGINTSTPTETLDVNGIAHGDLLYLRSPGEPLELPIYFMASPDHNLNVYNPAIENSSLVNLLNLTFNRVGNQGVTAYNTKISAANFIAAVRSFSFTEYVTNGTPGLNVYTVHDSSPSNNNSSTYYQGSPDFTAYIAPTDPANPSSAKTWWVRARYVDSRFTHSDGVVENSDRFVIKLQLLVYRKLITKYIDQTQTINLGGNNGSSSTYVVPKPSGF